MKRLSVCSSLLALGLALSPSLLTAQNVLINEDFDYGVPSTFRNLDGDGCTVDSGFRITVTGSWFPGWVYASRGKVAMSTSHHVEDAPANNWLITPQIHITSPEIFMTWDAKSCHFDMPETYSILVSTTDNNPGSFVEIARIDGENYHWTHRLISLADYEGKDIYVAIRHESQSKFILAIDNLYIGSLNAVNLSVDNASRYFCGDTGVHPIVGTVTNMGRPLNVRNWVCVSGVGEYTQTPVSPVFATGERFDFHFDIPVYVGETSHYQVFAETDEGERISVLRDSVVCSYFPRTLLVEKGTAVWCTACPGVMASLNTLKDRYRDEMVLVEAHSAYNDYAEMSCEDYDRGMNTNNYPVIYYNREQAYPQYTAKSRLAEVINHPTLALTQLQVHQSGRDSVSVDALVTFANDMDNSTDRYRLGFAVVEHEMRLPYSLQKSNCSELSQEEYGMMRSPVPAEWMFYHNTVRSCEEAFTGHEKSVPDEIQAGQTYTYTTKLPIPSNMNDRAQLSVVAFAIDTMTNTVMNTCIAPLDYDPTVGIHTVLSDDSFRFVAIVDGCMVVPSLPFPYQVFVFNAAGQLLDSYQGEASAPTRVALPKSTPCVISIVQNGKTTVTRFVR